MHSQTRSGGTLLIVEGEERDYIYTMWYSSHKHKIWYRELAQRE